VCVETHVALPMLMSRANSPPGSSASHRGPQYYARECLQNAASLNSLNTADIRLLPEAAERERPRGRCSRGITLAHFEKIALFLPLVRPWPPTPAPLFPPSVRGRKGEGAPRKRLGRPKAVEEQANRQEHLAGKWGAWARRPFSAPSWRRWRRQRRRGRSTEDEAGRKRTPVKTGRQRARRGFWGWARRGAGSAGRWQLRGAGLRSARHRSCYPPRVPGRWAVPLCSLKH